MKEVSKNLMMALIAQVISLLASTVMSLVVPKFLSIEQYAYWQLFLLYNSYVGFFLFGLNGGIYLKEGGKKRKDIDKVNIGNQIRFGVIAQVVFSVILLLYVIFFVKDENRGFVYVSTVIYLVISNTNDLFGYLFQAVNETRLFSLATTIDRFLYLLGLVIFVGLNVTSFEPYIIMYICTKFIALSFSLYNGRDLIFVKKIPFKTLQKDIFDNIKIGLKLSISTIAGSLILGSARFLIDANMGLETFGKVSFSLSLASFILVFSSQFAMVLFPELRRKKENNLTKSFLKINNLLSLMLPAVYLLYYPVCFIIEAWLPQYKDSLAYLGILLPLCVYDGKMNLVGTTYFKVLRLETRLLVVNLVSMISSFILEAVSCFFYKNVSMVLIMAVLIIIIRSCYSEFYFYKKFNLKRDISITAEFVLAILFYISLINFSIGIILLLIAYMTYMFKYRVVLKGIKS